MRVVEQQSGLFGAHAAGGDLIIDAEFAQSVERVLKEIDASADLAELMALFVNSHVPAALSQSCGDGEPCKSCSCNLRTWRASAHFSLLRSQAKRSSTWGSCGCILAVTDVRDRRAARVVVIHSNAVITLPAVRDRKNPR